MKAINIPGIKSCIRIIIFSFLLTLCSFKAQGDSEVKIFYTRFDMRFIDNRAEKSNLLMVPANNDYRTAKFTTLTISGSASFSAFNQSNLDIQTRAAHNAIKFLLETKGLKSLKSKTTTFKTSLSHAQVVMSYEGAVKVPYRIITKNFDVNTDTYTTQIEIDFAPIAFPDKWKDMEIKHKIKQVFQDFIPFFDRE